MVQPDIGSLALLRTSYANSCDVRFNPIHYGQGQAEEPDLRDTDRGVSLIWNRPAFPYRGKVGLVGLPPCEASMYGRVNLWTDVRAL